MKMKTVLFFIGFIFFAIAIVVIFSGKASMFGFPDTTSKGDTSNSTSLKKSYIESQANFYDLATPKSECVFADVPNISAPLWVCTVDNAANAALGSALIAKDKDKEKALHQAYISALSELSGRQKIYVESMTKSRNDGTIESETKQTAHMKFGSNVTIKYVTTIKSKDMERIFLQLTQVEFAKGDCHYKYTGYSQKTVKGFETSSYDGSNRINAGCDFDELVKSLDNEGIKVEEVALSPMQTFYVAVVASQKGLNNIVQLPIK